MAMSPDIGVKKKEIPESQNNSSFGPPYWCVTNNKYLKMNEKRLVVMY
jgi:hypothetical protein